MAPTRTVLLGMEVRESKRANTCAHNRKNHKVSKGDTWLVVTEAGATSRKKGYCIPCAQRILNEAKATIEARLAEINDAAGRSTRQSEPDE